MEYDVESNWIPINTPPLSGTRCLVNDGELVLFAKYVQDEKHSTWIFEGLNEEDKFEVIGWMPTPKPMKKPAYVEIPLPKN